MPRAIPSGEIFVPPDLDREGIEHFRQKIEALLNRLTIEAESWAESGARKIGQSRLERRGAPLRCRTQNAGQSVRHSTRMPEADAAYVVQQLKVACRKNRLILPVNQFKANLVRKRRQRVLHSTERTREKLADVRVGKGASKNGVSFRFEYSVCKSNGKHIIPWYRKRGQVRNMFRLSPSPWAKDVLSAVRKSCDKHGVKLALAYEEGDWT